MADDDVKGDAAVAAFMAAMVDLFGAMPGAQTLESADLFRYATGMPVARFNGICVLGPDADEASATAWLADLEAEGLPRCILARPQAPPWVEGLAARHGLTDVHHEPLMVHPDPAAVAVPGTPEIHRVDPEDPDDVAVAQELFAEGFEAPLELLAPLMSARILALPAMAAYVGRADDGPCTVGFGALHDGHVGVFNIATPARHRRRGHGHAVTARVVAEGVASGARAAYLQASELGYPVYERMGFRTVETWTARYPSG